MTRQEAIDILKSKMDGSIDTSYEWAEAIRMAIQALKQPEPCKDTISRQAAIDAIVNRTVTVDTDAQWLSGHARCELEIIDIINALPSAQPEPHEIGYLDCSNALLKMWMDNVLTDGEYKRIADRLSNQAKRRDA